MTDAELQQAAADLTVEVLLLDVPDPERPVPSGGPGYYWRVGEETIHDNDEPLEVACRFFRDLWRRLQVERLVAQRGLPAELVRATWAVLPYESVPFRLGWQRWRELGEATRAGVIPSAPGSREGGRRRSSSRADDRGV